jgi:hypothetical protein
MRKLIITKIIRRDRVLPAVINFIVDKNDNFRYITSNNTNLYTLSGNFTNGSPISITSKLEYEFDENGNPDQIHNFHVDTENKQLLIVHNDYVKIYSLDNFDECGELSLLDQIKLLGTTTEYLTWSTYRKKFGEANIKFKKRPYITYNPNNPEFIKFSNKYRTTIIDNKLYLYGKYYSDVYKIIDLTPYGVYNIQDIDIRDGDNDIMILHKHESSFYVLYISQNSNFSAINKKLESFNVNSSDYKVKFSDLDSNLFYTYNKSEYQCRFLTNPQYPCGRLELSELFYYNFKVWGETHNKFGEFRFKWN